MVYFFKNVLDVEKKRYLCCRTTTKKMKNLFLHNCITFALLIALCSWHNATGQTVNGATVVCPNIPTAYSLIGNLPTDAVARWSVSNGTILGSNTGNLVNIVFDENVDNYTITINFDKEKPRARAHKSIEYRVRKKLFNNAIVNLSGNAFNFSSSSVSNIKGNISDEYEAVAWRLFPETIGSIIRNPNDDSDISISWNNVSDSIQGKLLMTVRMCERYNTVAQTIYLKPAVSTAPKADIKTCADAPDPLPAPSFTLSNTNFCPEGAIHLRPDVMHAGSTYLWTIYNAGTNIVYATNSMTDFNFMPGADGAYDIALTETNSFGCSATSRGQVIARNDNEIYGATVAGNASAYAGDAIVLAVILNAPIGSYQWMNGNAVLAGETGTTLTVKQTGSYWAKLTTVQGCKHNDLEAMSVVFHAAPEEKAVEK
jgi:hypothetical protein